MRPHFEIARKLVMMHVEVLEQSRLLSGLDVQIGILDKLDLLAIAMDIIGYPPDNSSLFDMDILNGKEGEGNTGLRTDFEYLFARDHWGDMVFGLEKKDVDSFVEQLYGDYDGLILERPELFVKE